jgi:hypothetical protein
MIHHCNNKPKNKMKKTITIFIMLALIGLSNVTNGQAPNWIWAKSAGSTGSENGNSTTTDAFGNVYVTGGFTSPTITFGATTLTNAGGNDMFLVKYDASGNVIWAKRAGGGGNEFGQSVATDASGNVYVTGGFSSASIILGTDTLTNAGGTDIMIIKYDASGNLIWAKSDGGTGTENGQSIATDVSGNLYVTGSFTSPTITFGANTFNGNTGGFGGSDVFIVKYNASGNVLWAKVAGGNIFDNKGQGIATDASCNVYVTGYFDHPGITFGTITVYDHGGLGLIYDMFVVKYDSSGNVVWAKGAGTQGDDRGYSITTDAFGNVYAIGGTNYSITIGASTFYNVGGRDIFIIKYDSSGNVLWAKGAGGSGDDYCQSCTIDASGNLYVTGYYNSPYINLGSSTLLVNTDGWGVTYDMFVIKYDPSGNLLWAMSEGGGYGDDKAYGVTTDSSGNVSVTGGTNSTITLGATTLPNAGGTDMFIAKLGTTTTGIENNTLNNEVSVYPSPTTGLLFLSNNYNVTLTDLAGKIIIQEENASTIDISNQPAGMYFLLLIANKGQIVKRSKIMKE